LGLTLFSTRDGLDRFGPCFLHQPAKSVKTHSLLFFNSQKKKDEMKNEK
jgi:hypothetical protein